MVKKLPLTLKMADMLWLSLQEAAAALVAEAPEDPDAAHRVDLTQHDVMTIDDASTTEVDDGLSVEFLPDGRRRLWVHVADPTRWVQPGSPLDLEARRRGSTMYLPTGDSSTPEMCSKGVRVCTGHDSVQLWPSHSISAPIHENCLSFTA